MKCSLNNHCTGYVVYFPSTHPPLRVKILMRVQDLFVAMTFAQGVIIAGAQVRLKQ